MCGFFAEARSRACNTSDEVDEIRWFTATEIELAVQSDELRLSPPVSIAFQLLAEWYQKQSGKDLDSLVRNAGSWLDRKGIK